MITVSGFTFIHNAIESGYPIIEAIRSVQPYVNEIVVVDMQSTDNTRDVLKKLSETCLEKGQMIAGKRSCNCAAINIINGFWGNKAGETLRQAHNQYRQCSGDIIIHFEADEIYSPELLESVIHLINQDVQDIAIYRLQLEQNFQRCRWYPEPVHRIFPRLSSTRKEGHTTNRHHLSTVLGPENGFLWDITNCFRDNWTSRVEKQAELRDELPNYLMTPVHSLHETRITEMAAQKWLFTGRHWKWKKTPFDIPEILKPLVGMTKYEPKI